MESDILRVTEGKNERERASSQERNKSWGTKWVLNETEVLCGF